MDKIEAQGHWKRSSSQVVDRYISVIQPHVDEKVEGVLYVGISI
jgi:hypothetical protein